MEVAYECIPCTLKSCLRLIEEGGIEPDEREHLLRNTLSFLANSDWRQSPPSLARELHAMLRREGRSEDPYADIKRRSNKAMLERIPELRTALGAATDPFALGVRLAVAGNVIDFGARHFFDPAKTIRRVMTADLAVDATEDLRSALHRSKSVLYIGDNAGEIVMDGLFLETLDHPQVTFVVRGGPVINDATLDDAVVAGIPARARVITTGDDAPGVIPSRVSEEFTAEFERADVVIAKGQGNLEGLWDAQREIYFLLTVKCERVARHIGVEVGDFVVWKHTSPVG